MVEVVVVVLALTLGFFMKNSGGGAAACFVNSILKTIEVSTLSPVSATQYLTDF